MADTEKTPPFVPAIPSDAKRAAPHPPPADLTKPPSEPKPSIPVPDNGNNSQEPVKQLQPDDGAMQQHYAALLAAQQQRVPHPPPLEPAFERQDSQDYAGQLKASFDARQQEVAAQNNRERQEAKEAPEPQPMEAMFYQMRDDQKKLERAMLIAAIGVIGGAIIILYVYKKNGSLTPDFDAMRGVE